MKNFIRLKSRKQYAEYAYFDLPEYKADHIFIKNKLPIKIHRELGRAGYDYFIILCRVKREQAELFEKCMEELRNAMLVCGHRDYDDFCEEMGNLIEKGCA